MERISCFIKLFFIVILIPLQRTVAQQKPNIIFIMTDDLGYRDVGNYGYGTQRLITPNLDSLTKLGRKFTNYYAASNVCTPSRAGLLTGCYPQRINMSEVLFPETGPAYIQGKNNKGLGQQEVTIASLLKANGYVTACCGKWHLGYQKQFLPLQHGFDEFYGIPYSHDMIPQTDSSYPTLPLIMGNEPISKNVAIDTLTQTFTNFSIDFINKNKSRPFFLYLTYSMPHVPLAVSKKFVGITKKGLYADVIFELDDAVGRIYKTLEINKIEKNTLIIFTSDNGPWLLFGNHAGKQYGLREGKSTTYDGGNKVPFIAVWKSKIIPNSTTNEPLSGTDILPTLASLTESGKPNLKIDGHNLSNLLLQKKPQSNHHPIFFFNGMELQGVRQNNFKYHFQHEYDSVEVVGNNGAKGKLTKRMQTEALYNLQLDPGEKINLIKTHQSIANHLKQIGIIFREEIEKEQRPNGKIN